MRYNVHMRFEVPQFIEVEAKIVGPLTWKQFVYVAGGAGLLVILFLSLPFMLFILIGLPVGAIAGSLAFHRINNRPFSIFLESIVNYFVKKKLYLWKREEMQSVIQRNENTGSDSANNLEYTHKKTISSLSRDLEINNQRNISQ